jgi:hypothetical protein
MVATACACTLTLGLFAAPVAADHHEEKKPAAAAQGAQDMTPEMQAMMAAWEKAATPGEQHRQLAAMAGKWKATVKTWMMGPEPTVSEATVERKMMLDGRVLADQWSGNMMGQPFVGHGMTGYDNTTGKYWSTWNDNMSTGVFVSWGKWDDATKSIVFEGEMSDPMAGGAPIKVKSTTRTNADGSETFEMWEPRGPNGAMVRTMEATLVKQ